LPLGLIDRLFSPAPASARIAWLATHEYAHRGLHGPGLHGAGAPENSPAAFAAAIARGMGIECDVQRSGDGQAMVFHDWELDRLTGQSGPVAGLNAAALAQVALTGGSDCIPSLHQVLELVAGRAVMSFDPRVGKWFAEHSPRTVRGLVMSEEDDRGLVGRLRRHLWLWAARPDFLAYDVRDLPSRFAGRQRARGIPVLTWTVRSPELRARAAEYADAPIAEGAGVESQPAAHGEPVEP